MSAIATALIGAITKEGIGRISKTKVFTHATGLQAVVPLLPAAFSGDATAIGQIIGMLVTWGLVLWGRGNKG